MNIEVCDKCHGKVIDGKCPCGVWLDTKDVSNFTRLIQTVLLGYDYLYDHNLIGSSFSSDHFSGNCMILFRGDYDLCMKVRDFLAEEQATRGYDS